MLFKVFPYSPKEGRLETNSGSQITEYLHLPFKIQNDHPLPFIISSLNKGGWCAGLDLKDAYFHIDIHPAHRRFLHFYSGPRPLLMQAASFQSLDDPKDFHEGAIHGGSISAYPGHSGRYFPISTTSCS